MTRLFKTKKHPPIGGYLVFLFQQLAFDRGYHKQQVAL
jgi:hypothetical protein